MPPEERFGEGGRCGTARRPAISLGNGGPAQILLHDAFLSQSTPHAWPGGLLAVGAPCGAERRGHVGRLTSHLHAKARLISARSLHSPSSPLITYFPLSVMRTRPCGGLALLTSHPLTQVPEIRPQVQTAAAVRRDRQTCAETLLHDEEEEDLPMRMCRNPAACSCVRCPQTHRTQAASCKERLHSEPSSGNDHVSNPVLRLHFFARIDRPGHI